MSGDFQIGEWRVQPAVNRLRRGEQLVRLEPKVMQVLVCLAESAGEVVTREELTARVWPDVFVTDDVLHRAIRELRRVFGDSTASPSYIETIRKRGYRLMLPTSVPTDARACYPAATSVPEPPTRAATPTSVPELPAPAATPTSVPDPAATSVPAWTIGPGQGNRSPRTWQFSLLVAIVALTVAAAVLVVAGRETDTAPEAHARFVPIVSGPLNESDPAMSPNGRRIAFVQREPRETASADIYIRDLEDGRVTRVTDHPASDRVPAWSHDAARLAFVRATPSSCEVVVRTLASNSETRVAACGNTEDPKLTWTTDGRALLTSLATGTHVTSGWRIARLDITTGEFTELTAPPSGVIGDHSPAVSPDGRHFAYIRRASGGVSDIYVSSIDGIQTRRLTFDESDLTGIDWSNDGRSIVYSSDRAGGYSLWRASIDGSAPTLLAGGAARMKHPVADRSSRRVVYENWNYEINVWQTAIAGRVAQAGQLGDAASPITRTSDLWNLYPQVSPDAQRVAYVSTQTGSHELWVADRDGANARQLTDIRRGVVKTPRWSPDGRRIVYIARGQGTVDVQYVDLATGIATSVTSTPINEVAPAWSHDGTRILFGAPDASGRPNVWSVVAAAGPHDAHLEIANAVAAQPAPDGSALYFTRPDQPGLWRVRTGRAQSVERVIDTIPAGNTQGWEVTSHGIYFLDERDDTVHLRLASHDGVRQQDVATLTQFTWPGFSVTPDGGAVLWARWDRRDSNLMSIEY